MGYRPIGIFIGWMVEMNMKKIRILLLVLLPVVLYIVALQAARWHPKLVATVPPSNVNVTYRTEAVFTFNGAISPDEKWYVSFYQLSGKNESKLAFFNLESQETELTKILPAAYGAEYVSQWLGKSRNIATTGTIREPKPRQHKVNVSLYNLDGTVREFQGNSREINPEYITDVRLSPDESKLWLATDMGFFAWDMKSRKLVTQWSHDNKAFAGYLSSDCNFYFQTLQKSFQKFDIKSQKPVGPPVVCGEGEIQEIRFTPDGSIALCQDHRLAGSQPAMLRAVEVKSGKLLWKTQNKALPFISPDSRFCLLTTADYVEMRDTRTGKVLKRLARLRGDEKIVPLINENALYTLEGKVNLYRTRLK